jgi:hypothetical protein
MSRKMKSQRFFGRKKDSGYAGADNSIHIPSILSGIGVMKLFSKA